MYRGYFFPEIVLLASLLSLVPPAAAFADEASDALKKCDALASHPHDPGRYAAGVTDEQFAPGAAIEACEPAAKLNPDVARVWFELGRSYWIGQRDKEAFAAFVEAAKRNYAPAMKYLGDAYLEGRGLPAGQAQDGQTALTWYKKSADAGFVDGVKAVEEVQGYLKKKAADDERARLEAEKAKFDPSIFQNGAFMAALYNATPVPGNQREAFIKYVYGFTEKLSGDTIIFLEGGQYCKPLISASTSTRLQNGFLAAMTAQAYRDNGRCSPLSGGRCSLIDMTSYNRDREQGERDAVALFNRYGCQSDVTHKIIDGVNQFSALSSGAQPDSAPEGGGLQAPNSALSRLKPKGSCIITLSQWRQRAPARAAFAVSRDGHGCGWSQRQANLEIAHQKAIGACSSYGRGCEVIDEK
jgi:TPR repeat protein